MEFTFYMFIGKSLSEPNTDFIAHVCVYVCACLLACYHALLACGATPLQNSYSPRGTKSHSLPFCVT